jgi:hypothetical protein
MSIAEKLQIIAENERKVYKKGLVNGESYGYSLGYDEGQNVGYGAGFEQGEQQGKQAEWNEFWDAIQNYGNLRDYYYVFAYINLGDDNFNPKYPIICEGSVSANGMFYGSGGRTITDTKVPIELRTTGNATFYSCSNLVTVRKLIVYETTTFDRNFLSGTSSLKNITIEGTIGNDLIISSSKVLTKASIESVINALSTTTTGKTLTLNKTAVQSAFGTNYDSSTEWTTLKNSKPNWTITLS